jgi:hypothetical protein
MRLLERTKLEGRGRVVVVDDRPVTHLEELVAYAVQVGGHVEIAAPLRPSQAARLTAIADARHLTLRTVSRVIVS